MIFRALQVLALCATPAALSLVATSCRSTDGQSPVDTVVPPGDGPSAEAFLLNSLGRTVEAREDDVARRLLVRLRAMRPSDQVVKIADAYERILDGRALVATLDLSLAVRAEAEDVPGAERGARAWRVVLVAQTGAERPLDLNTGPATLEVERTTVDGAGRERVDRQTRSFAMVSELALPAQGVREVELDRVEEAFPPGALAQRWRWRLKMRAGEIEDAGRSYPAMRVRVTPVETSRIAPGLRRQTVTPEELAAEMAGGRLELQAALELAVCVRSEERQNALDAISEVVEDLPLPAVARLAPALRWLAPDADAGGDPVAWKAWLRRRPSQGGPSRGGDSGLVLPR
jgi:hypothetical protein